jgi:hypothetical protein
LQEDVVRTADMNPYHLGFVKWGLQEMKPADARSLTELFIHLAGFPTQVEGLLKMLLTMVAWEVLIRWAPVCDLYEEAFCRLACLSAKIQACRQVSDSKRPGGVVALLAA